MSVAIIEIVTKAYLIGYQIILYRNNSAKILWPERSWRAVHEMKLTVKFIVT